VKKTQHALITRVTAWYSRAMNTVVTDARNSRKTMYAHAGIQNASVNEGSA
jgi:hypothetical protein